MLPSEMTQESSMNLLQYVVEVKKSENREFQDYPFPTCHEYHGQVRFHQTGHSYQGEIRDAGNSEKD